jgi:biotin carboxyl carrier protein
MKLIATIGGTEHVIEISSNGDSPNWNCRIGGVERRADVRQVEPGVYSILLNGRSFEVQLENNGGRPYASVNGRRLAVEIRDPRKMVRGGGAIGVAGPQTIASPMPGKVVRLLVAEGDEVEAGHGLLIVEAMKMQNEIKSTKAGRVAAINVTEGSAVGGGQAMMVVE